LGTFNLGGLDIDDKAAGVARVLAAAQFVHKKLSKKDKAFSALIMDNFGHRRHTNVALH
jgi:hypothetical protein